MMLWLTKAPMWSKKTEEACSVLRCVPMLLLSLALGKHWALLVKVMICPEQLPANLKFSFNLETEKKPFSCHTCRSFYSLQFAGAFRDRPCRGKCLEIQGINTDFSGPLHWWERSKWTKTTAAVFLDTQKDASEKSAGFALGCLCQRNITYRRNTFSRWPQAWSSEHAELGLCDLVPSQWLGYLVVQSFKPIK